MMLVSCFIISVNYYNSWKGLRRLQGQYSSLTFLGSFFLARSHSRKKRLLISSRPSLSFRPSFRVYISAAPIGRISVTRELRSLWKSISVKRNQLMHNLFLVYFVNISMFRAYLGPPSGVTTVCIQQLVLIFLDDCLLFLLDWNNPTRTTDSHLKRIIRGQFDK
jgi:hypothetical protein